MFEIVARELRAKLLGRRRGLTGQRADAPSHTSATRRRRCGGRRRVRRAWLRRPWEAAGPGQASRRRTQPHTATQRRRCGGRRRDRRAWLRCPWAAAGPGCGGRGRRQGQSKHTRLRPRPIGGRRGACGAWPGFETTRRAELAARTASGRAGHAAAGDQAGPETPAARQTALTLRRRAPGVPCS